MPREILEYYRYRRTYHSDDVQHKDFSQMVIVDEDVLTKKLPSDCSSALVYNKFKEEHEDGSVTIYYFEDQDEMYGYKAATFNDPEIYHDYKREKREYEMLTKHNADKP